MGGCARVSAQRLTLSAAAAATADPLGRSSSGKRLHLVSLALLSMGQAPDYSDVVDVAEVVRAPEFGYISLEQ